MSNKEQSHSACRVYVEPMVYVMLAVTRTPDRRVNLLDTIKEATGIEFTPEASPRKEWTGVGLPPVGTVCEYKHLSGWRKVEVFAVKPNYNGSHTALFTYESGKWAGCAEPSFFRPIRTPEQIAKEEREKAIQEIIREIGWISKVPVATDAAARVYDAGYRKQPTQEATK